MTRADLQGDYVHLFEVAPGRVVGLFYVGGPCRWLHVLQGLALGHLEGDGRSSTAAATRLARLQERLAEVRRTRAGEQGPVVVYEDDDKRAVQEHVARRERMGAGLVVIVRCLATRPAGNTAPWRS